MASWRDLGYETYQKILSQAVTELKNDEFQDLYEEEMNEGKQITGDDFIDDCAVESDLEMYFPDNYVPGSSERMLLYRELDNIEKDEDLDAYRKRLQDRFGPIPRQGEELMQVVALRRVGKRLGCERLFSSKDACRCSSFPTQTVCTTRVKPLTKYLITGVVIPRRLQPERTER